MASRKVITRIDNLGTQSHRVKYGLVTPIQPAKGDTFTCQGVWNTKFIHLDVITPYESEIGQAEVRKTLEEQVGEAKLRGKALNWYEYYNESTPQGSSHRVIVFLSEDQPPSTNIDASYPIEAGLLAGLIAWWEAKGMADSMTLVHTGGSLYSLLMLNHTPHHLLKLDPKTSVPDLVKRLEQHAAYNKNSAEGGKNPDLMYVNFENNELISRLRESTGLGEEIPARDLKFGNLLHAGLARCSTGLEWTRLDGVDSSHKAERNKLREKRMMLKAMVISAAVGCLLLGITSIPWFKTSAKMGELGRLINEHKPLVELYKKNREKLNSRVTSLTKLEPMWQTPLPWHDIFTELNSTLPKEGGISNLIYVGESSTVEFEAWVREWDNVTEIQTRLESSHYFKKVFLSGQKKIARKNIVRFKVTCRLSGKKS